jgi:hypothetical protein
VVGEPVCIRAAGSDQRDWFFDNLVVKVVGIFAGANRGERTLSELGGSDFSRSAYVALVSAPA